MSGERSEAGISPCSFDGVLLDDHARCSNCTILVGVGHLEKDVNADGLCEYCAGRTLRPVMLEYVGGQAL